MSRSCMLCYKNITLSGSAEGTAASSFYHFRAATVSPFLKDRRVCTPELPTGNIYGCGGHSICAIGLMTVDFYTPTFLGHDLHSDVHRNRCTIPSLARSLDTVCLNGLMSSSAPLKLDVGAQGDVADSSSADGSEQAERHPSAEMEAMSSSSSGVSNDEHTDEPLLSPNEERFVMYPIRWGPCKMIPCVTHLALSSCPYL